MADTVSDQIDFGAYFTDPTYKLPSWATQQPSATGLLDQVSSAVGKVADFGFNLQKQQYAVQAQAQDNQLKTLMSNLGFQTAMVQANSAAKIAEYNAIGAQNKAAQANGIPIAGMGGGLSMTTLLLLGFGFYFLSQRKG